MNAKKHNTRHQFSFSIIYCNYIYAYIRAQRGYARVFKSGDRINQRIEVPIYENLSLTWTTKRAEGGIRLIRKLASYSNAQTSEEEKTVNNGANISKTLIININLHFVL